jgi:hypothetical protein
MAAAIMAGIMGAGTGAAIMAVDGGWHGGGWHGGGWHGGGWHGGGYGYGGGCRRHWVPGPYGGQWRCW